jgi:hypothetical protein
MTYPVGYSVREIRNAHTHRPSKTLMSWTIHVLTVAFHFITLSHITFDIAYSAYSGGSSDQRYLLEKEVVAIQAKRPRHTVPSTNAVSRSSEGFRGKSLTLTTNDMCGTDDQAYVSHQNGTRYGETTSVTISAPLMLSRS